MVAPKLIPEWKMSWKKLWPPDMFDPSPKGKQPADSEDIVFRDPQRRQGDVRLKIVIRLDRT